MSSHSVRAQRAEVRAYMAKNGVNYTTALRALNLENEAPAAGPPVDDAFGGHEFNYEQSTDLFRCWMCKQYEAVARSDDGSIAPCPGLAEYRGATERLYLKVIFAPGVRSNPWLADKVGAPRLGRLPRFATGPGYWLVETVPDLAAALEKHVKGLTTTKWTRSLDGDRPAGETTAFASIERLSASEGQALIADHYIAYVAEFGEPGAR